jgi:hypothetical protein
LFFHGLMVGESLPGAYTGSVFLKKSSCIHTVF